MFNMIIHQGRSNQNSHNPTEQAKIKDWRGCGVLGTLIH